MPSSHLILCRPLLFPSIKVFSNKSVLPASGKSFPEFQFPLESSNFNINNKCYHLFPWNDRFFLYSFLRKYLPNTRVWITIVCQFFLSNGNGIPWKSTVRSAPDWHSHTSLYLEMAVALSPQWKCFLYSFPIIIQNIKNMCSLGSRFNKTKNFYCLIKDVMWTGIFFFLPKMVVKKTRTLPMIWCHWLDSCSGISSSTSLTLAL